MSDEKKQLREIQAELENISRSLYEMKHKLLLGVNTKIDWTKYPASFALKFCDPLPEVSEDELLKPREWSISQAEVDETAGRE